MENLKQLILKNKPNLSASSLKTYVSTLSTLYKKVFNSDDYLLANFNYTDKFLEHIKDKPASTRKSSLSALVVLTGNEKYKTEMMSCISQHNQVVNKQEQNEKQKENNVSIDEMDDIYDNLVNQAKCIYKKKKLTDKDHQQLQDYILVSLMNGKYSAPRRSMDWTEFKLSYNTEQAGCNYMDGNQFIFNTYKGSGSKGQQKINIPNELKAIIDKYRKVSENEYLFYDLNDSKMNSGKITKKLNKIYGKKFSVNGMRHAYMSNKYSKTIETNNAIAEDLKAMGSSALQSQVYINKIEK